jgi:ABC-type amino acid transport substrate-binding protein
MKFSGRIRAAFAAGTLWCVLPAAIGITAAQATDTVELRTAAQQGTAPKFVAAESASGTAGPATGLCIDLHRAIERIDPGLRITGDQQWRPLPRMEAELRAGSLDIACAIMRNREREAELTYLEPALVAVTYHLVVRADDPVDIVSWDDVRNLGDKGTILAMHGFGQVARLKELGGLTVDSGAADAATNLRKLLAGRGRFYYHRSPGIVGEIRKAGLEGKVRILPALMDIQRFYMVAGRHVPPAVVARLNRALAQLEASGELRRLNAKWYEESPLDTVRVALAPR